MVAREKLTGFISDEEMNKISPSSISSIKTKAGFISDEEMDKISPVDPEKEISEAESAARGFAQGATLGFADEISGGVESLFTDKSYEQARDESRKNFKTAEKANPGYYLAGEVGGGLATAAIPFGGTATLGKAIATGAKLGGVTALGNSEADNIKDVAKDVGSGIALGAGGGALGVGASKVVASGVSSLKKLPSKFIKKGLEDIGDSGANILSKETGQIPIENPNVFKEAASSAKNRLKSFWNPDIDPSFEELANIAKKNGIDPNDLPESIKFGPDSSASRSARNLAEGRFGEETLKRFNKTLDKVRDAYDNKIVSYTKGVPVDEVTAGKILRDSYDEGVSKFFDQMDITHNYLVDQVPGLKITDEAIGELNSALNGIEKFAKGRMARGVTSTQKGQGQQLINAVESIRAGNGSYKQTVEALRDIGEAAFQSKNTMADVPVDVQKMRKIYNDLNNALVNSVKSQLGDDIASSLVENNKLMSEFFGDKSLISGIMGDKSIAPEKAFRSLVLSGDTQKLNALKKVISPEKFDYLKGALLENITKRDPEGNFTFKQLHNAMRSKKSALSTIFTPEELADHAGLVRLGDRFGSPVLSSSGTGASISFQDLYQVPANLSVDAIALSNANRAAKSALEKSPQKTLPKTNFNKEVPKFLKGAPIKAAAVGLSTPEKGYEKWASDGAKKLIQHDSEFTLEQINQIKQSKKGRDLLIKASDLQPKSKAMSKIVEQIRSGSISEEAE